MLRHLLSSLVIDGLLKMHLFPMLLLTTSLQSKCSQISLGFNPNCFVPITWITSYYLDGRMMGMRSRYLQQPDTPI